MITTLYIGTGLIENIWMHLIYSKLHAIFLNLSDVNQYYDNDLSPMLCWCAVLWRYKNVEVTAIVITYFLSRCLG